MRNIVVFVSLLVILTACNATPESTIAFAELPDSGDPVRGEQIYTQYSNPLCSSCHVEGATGAPTLLDYNEAVAAERVEGQSAREYTFYAIVEPWQHIAEGYGNAMPNQYDERLAPQDIADLIAYLHED